MTNLIKQNMISSPAEEFNELQETVKQLLHKSESFTEAIEEFKTLSSALEQKFSKQIEVIQVRKSRFSFIS